MSLLVNEIHKISTVTPSDWIEIRATLQAIENPDFQCQVCLGDPRGDKALEFKKLGKACTEHREAPLWVLDGVSFYTCIGNFVSESVLSWLSAYHQWKQGVMPFPGSFFDQPAKAIDVFTAIEGHFQRIEEQRRKRERAKQHVMQSRGLKRGR